MAALAPLLPCITNQRQLKHKPYTHGILKRLDTANTPPEPHLPPVRQVPGVRADGRRKLLL